MQQSKAKRTRGAMDLTTGSPTQKIIAFTVPLLLGNVFQLLYSWTDAIIIGKVKGDVSAFSSLSAAMPIVNLLLTAVMGFIAGAGVIIGQYFGNKKNAELKKSYSTLLISIFVIGLVIMALGLALSKPLLQLLRLDPLLLKNATTYLMYYFGGLLFMIAYNVFAQVLRSLGNSIVPLVALILCVVLNVILDYLFVIPMGMGIEGVAIATMIAQAVSAVLLFVYIQTKVPLLHIGKSELKMDKKMLHRILGLAVPSTIQNICACVGFLVINAMVNGSGGNFTTAFGLGSRIDELLNQVTASFGIAITSYTAQNKGKGEIRRIKQGFVRTLLLVSGFMLVAGSFILIFKDFLLNIFTNLDAEPKDGIDMKEVHRITVAMLNVYVPSFYFMALINLTSGLLRGSGAAKSAMGINLFSLIIRMTAAFSLFQIHEFGVFYASPIGWIAGAAWGLVAVLRGKWADTKTIDPPTVIEDEPAGLQAADPETVKLAVAVILDNKEQPRPEDEAEPQSADLSPHGIDGEDAAPAVQAVPSEDDNYDKP